MKNRTKADAKAQLLTLDLLLALVPLTIALGISASAISGVSTSIEDYISIYSKQRVVSDAADVLIKTPGKPQDWNGSAVENLGFATYLGDWSCGTSLSNTTLTGMLDSGKLSSFQNINPGIPSTLQAISSSNNVRVLVTNSTDTLVDIMGYYSGGAWTVTNNSATINATVSGATDLYVTERPVGIVNITIGSLGLQNTFSVSSGPDIKSTPAVGDLDGDGTREIVFGSDDNNVYAYYPNGTQIWSFNALSDVDYSSPALVDLDLDGKLEVLVGTEGGRLYAINYNGTQRWSYSTGGYAIKASPSVADLFGDSHREIVFGDMNGDLRVLDYTGGLNWSKPIGTGDEVRTSAAIGDIDADGELEIVVPGFDQSGGMNPDGILYAFEADGTKKWEFAMADGMGMGMKGDSYTAYSTPSLYDVDDDNRADIFVGTMSREMGGMQNYNGVLYRLEDEGGSPPVRRWMVTGIQPHRSSPAVGDIDGDGTPEVVIGDHDNNKVYAYNAVTGATEPGWPYTTGGPVESSPSIGDVDGDCKMEVVVGSDDQYLYVLNGEDGSLEYRYFSNEKIKSSPIIVDLDDDKLFEIAFGNNDGNFYILETAGTSGAEWPMFHQCLKRAGYYYDPECAGVLRYTVVEEVAEDATFGNLKVYMWD